MRAKVILSAVAFVVFLAACVTNPYVERKREHCASLVETVEARIEHVGFSDDVLRVYRECVDEFGGGDGA